MTQPDAIVEHQLQELRAELARSQQQVADMAAAQEEFLRAVSHDLRAPLRHVTSYGTLVREVLSDLPPEVAQGPGVQEALGFLATMDQSAKRMGLMLDGLLALVRAGRAPLRHVTSYGTLVREVLGDLPPEVLGDLPPEVAQGPEVQEALGFLATWTSPPNAWAS